MNPRKIHRNPLTIPLIVGMLVLISLGCNMPGQPSSEDAIVEVVQEVTGSGDPSEVTMTIGPEGGRVAGLGQVELVVPEGAFPEPVEVKLALDEDLPALPAELDVKPAGVPVVVTLTPDLEPDRILELVLPFKRQDSAEDDHYAVLRWDGSRWTTAGGLVEEDRIRVQVDRFSTFLPAWVVWALRPVSFVNEGPYDAVVRPWTYQPIVPFVGVVPQKLATASFAPGGPGLWPNTSRFLGLPFGIYTFCIEWDEESDLDGDGLTDVFHAFLEGPSVDLPLLVDENDSIKMDFAEEIRFRTDPIGKEPGRCGVPAASEWTVRLLPLDVRTLDSPPDTIAIAQYKTTTPPDNVYIDSVDMMWESTDGEKIALYNEGDWISATCNDPNITAVGVRFESDSNDGWVRVLVDGREAWRGSIFGGDPGSEEGMFLNYLEVSGLNPGVHTILVESLGINGEGGGDDAAMRYFGFSSSPVEAP